MYSSSGLSWGVIALPFPQLLFQGQGQDPALSTWYLWGSGDQFVGEPNRMKLGAFFQ